MMALGEGQGLIISASRRTDIPAFYSEWFMNRISAGFCLVPNPLRPTQVSRVSLVQDEVDAIVFWSRDPRPLIPYLGELDTMGYRHIFQFTINGYPGLLEPGSPKLETAVAAFTRLADRIGPLRVVWRYDPIILSDITPPEYHVQRFAEIAEALEGSTMRVVVSLLDFYRKTKRRLRALEQDGRIALWKMEASGTPGQLDGGVLTMLARMAETARNRGMEITSCAEPYDLSACGIAHGACIDADMLRGALGIEVGGTKDPGQRSECRCAASRDIGVYDTCRHGCVYCYATDGTGPGKAHDPCAPALTGMGACTRLALPGG
jgi:hypothetical protein